MARVDGLLPLFPLDLVLFPGQALPLHIFEPRYKELIGECLNGKSPFGVVRASENTIADIGCTAEIVAVKQRYEDGRLNIETVGRRRFQVLEVNQDRSFVRAEIAYQEDEPGRVDQAVAQRTLELHMEVVQLIGPNQQYSPPDLGSEHLSYDLAGTLPLDLDFKQTLLRMRAEGDRLTALTAFYEEVLPRLRRAAIVRRKAGGNGHVL